MLKETGVPTRNQVFSAFPTIDQLAKFKVVIECYERIPCNPCESICPVGAIRVGEDINNIPMYHMDLCTGCTKCISVCPGQAIMMVEYHGDKSRFKIPYEFLPVPQKGEIWSGLNREGEILSDVQILSVQSSVSNNHTHVVMIEIDSKYLYDFRAIRCKNGK